MGRLPESYQAVRFSGGTSLELHPPPHVRVGEQTWQGPIGGNHELDRVGRIVIGRIGQVPPRFGLDLPCTNIARVVRADQRPIEYDRAD